MKPQIFRNAETQRRFDEDGFVVIDLISPQEAQTIARKFYEIHPVLPQGFYADAYSPEDNVKQEIYLHNDRILEKVLDEKFQNYKKLGSTFLCKAPGEIGRVGAHQDWTTVDEEKFYSITIWIPTEDTTEENGALRVLPGSHLFFDYFRSNNIPVAYRGSEEFIWQNMVTVPMKAGQAFVLNHAVLHGSSPNLTTKERLVIAYGMVPKDAQLCFYSKDKSEKSDRIEKFEMPDDFFQRYYNVGERPLFGNMVKEFDYPVPAFRKEQIEKMIQRERTKRREIPFFRDNWIEHKEQSAAPKAGIFKRILNFYKKENR